jgi:hypothetical protein
MMMTGAAVNYNCVRVRKRTDKPSKSLTLDLMNTLDLFSQGLAIIKTRPAIKVVQKILISKLCSVHVLYKIHPKKLQISQKLFQTVHEVQS